MGQRDFASWLKLGNMGEKLVAGWLQSRGWGVVPSYDFSGTNGDKAPRLQFARRAFALPDLDICKNGDRMWAEIKTYERAPLYQRLGFNTHAIGRRLYRQYLEVERETGTPVWLFVLEHSTGVLLVQELTKLTEHPCSCRGCRSGGTCYVGTSKGGVRNGVYFNRSEFQIVAKFGDEQLATIRGFHTELMGQRQGAA